MAQASTLDLKFPLGKTGGLIEAVLPGAARNGTPASFPLGKTGGLIEATSSPAATSVGVSGFRSVKPAASLKRHSMLRHSV